MKIKLPTKTFREALARIASIPGAQSASVHTQVVTLSADMAGMTLSRFTSEAKITLQIDDNVEVSDEEGKAIVNHSALTALANACNGKEIAVTSDEKELRLESGRGKWKLKVFDPDLMADAPEPELETEHINILLEDLTEMFSLVLPATSKEDGDKPHFTGVNISQREKGLYFIATDGRRAHIGVAPYNLPVNVIVPGEGVEAILKCIGGNTGAATLSVGESFATVSGSNLEISVTLMAASYPNIVDHFEKQSSIISKILVNRDELAEALEACAKVNESDSRVVTMKVSERSLEVLGFNGKESEGHITLDCGAETPASFGIRGAEMAGTLRKFAPGKDGTIEIAHIPGALAIIQPERMAFFATAQAKA